MIQRLLCLISLIVTGPASLASDLPSIIPQGAFGVLYITDVAVGTLPLLKGVKGKGRYLTTNEQGAPCEIEPVQFLAGSFGGRSIAVDEHSDDIVIEVYSAEISERLKHLQEVTSVEYSKDLQVKSGLDTTDAFIIQPKPFWSSWWRYSKQNLLCRPIT